MKKLLLLLILAQLYACSSSNNGTEIEYSKDLVEAKKITLPIDENTYYLSKSMFQFDEEDKDIQYKYLNATPWEGKTENFVLYSSGQWFLDYEETTPEEHSERWVNVKINGTEMADSVARGGVPKANNLVLEIDPNENESQRHTQIRFISKYDESDNDYYEVTLRVEQEGKPAE